MSSILGNRSLQVKILLGMLCSLIPLVLVVVLSSLSTKDIALDSSLNLIRLIHSTRAEQLQGFIQAQEEVFRGWSGEKISGMAYGTAIEYKTLQNLGPELQKKMKGRSGFSTLVVTDQRGTVLQAALGPKLSDRTGREDLLGSGLEASDRFLEGPAPRDVAAGLVSGDWLRSLGLNFPKTIAFARATEGSGGQVNGLVVGHVSWTGLQHIVEGMHDQLAANGFPQARAAVVEFPSLQVLAATEASAIGKRLQGVGQKRQELRRAGLDTAVRCESREGTFYAHASQAFPALEGLRSQVRLISLVDEASILAKSRQAMWTSLGIAGAGILFIVGIGIFVARVIATPVRLLVTKAGSIAQGNLDEAIDIHQKDEVGTLAEALRKMVGSLSEMIATSKDKSREAEENYAQARQALKEAEEAKQKAESARKEGMTQAAGQLQQIVERITSSAEEMSSQIEQASQGAEEQKQRASENASSMGQMNEAVLDVARNASSAAEVADEARNKAKQGVESLDDGTRQMQEVRTKAERLQGEMSELGNHADQIGQIVSTISDIADQTNLLALNAAIEAARAGEAGRGFAVVADEVRKLAEKTMAATRDVDGAVQTIQSSASKNVQETNEAVAALQEVTDGIASSVGRLQEIVRLAEDTARDIRSIATAAEEQSTMSDGINASSEEISRIASETSQAMSESARAVSDLSKLAQDLQSVIQDLLSDSQAS